VRRRRRRHYRNPAPDGPFGNRAIGSTDDLLYEAEQEYNDQDLSRIMGKPLDEIQALPTCEKRESVMNHRKEELRRLAQVYYRQRGWNSSGIPTTETLKRLGLWDFLNGETKDKIS
jgi:aldehyde:ferredoxin oxidoreductase